MFKANKIFYPAVLTVGGVYYHRVWQVLMIMIFLVNQIFKWLLSALESHRPPQAGLSHLAGSNQSQGQVRQGDNDLPSLPSNTTQSQHRAENRNKKLELRFKTYFWCIGICTKNEMIFYKWYLSDVGWVPHCTILIIMMISVVTCCML